MSGQSSASSPLISTRRRACTACQQAKRRCDQRLPRCGRCTQKGFEDCNYPSLEAAVAAADFNFFTDVLSGSAGTPTDSLHNIMPVPVVPEADNSWALYYSNASAAAAPTPSPSIMAPTSDCLSRDAVMYCSEQFRSYPRRWVSQNGVAPFIHPALYLPTTNGADGLPPVLQDCFCACAAYAAKNDENAALVLGVVEAKATALLYVPEQAAWTLPQQVASLQALVMYQIMRWFDGDIRQRVLADSVEPLLATWTSALQARVGTGVFSTDEAMPSSSSSTVMSDSHLPPPHQQSSSSAGSYPQQHDLSPDHSRSNTPGARLTKEELNAAWRRWLMAESIRRVLAMAHLVRAVYSTAKQGGGSAGGGGGGGYGSKLGGAGVTAGGPGHTQQSQQHHHASGGGSGGGGGGGGGHQLPHHHHPAHPIGLADMSFTAQARLWAATTAERWNRSREGDTAWWVGRMDFSGLLALADPREVDEFTVMMGVVFRGKDTIEDWVTHGPGGM